MRVTSRQKEPWTAVQNIELISNNCVLFVFTFFVSSPIQIQCLTLYWILPDINLYLLLSFKWYLHSSPISLPYFWLFASNPQSLKRSSISLEGSSYKESTAFKFSWISRRTPFWFFTTRFSCLGAARKVSPNWSLETMTCHSSHCLSIV